MALSIPAEAVSSPKNAKEIGTLGDNSVNGRVGYAPPRPRAFDVGR
ncbi:MAG TPA: hypothetical protein VG326_14545 [Tepidisphaeraceae bacterium]|nr:hypothetical protein [Tepidisphaeraceae bacterium]